MLSRRRANAGADALVVTYSATATAGMAEVILAPLSTGEYVLELTLTKDAVTATVDGGARP